MYLELKHLAPYLPYKIKVYDSVLKIPKVMNLGQGASTQWVGIKTVLNYYDNDNFIYKPVLRPLSDLIKVIEVNSKKFKPTDIFEIGDDDEGYHVDFGKGNLRLIQDLEFCSKHNDHNDLQYIPNIIHNQLIEWHFDVFGLIEKGLAIDINTLK